jgi:hypothetical protein
MRGPTLLLLCSAGGALGLPAVWPSGSAPLSFTITQRTFDGGGWVTGLEAHAATGIVYGRTDVGGAYRSDDAGDSWTWLTGAIPGDSWGTQGLAVNQSDASGQTVLLGVGTKGVASNWTGVWKSTDGGKSFRHVLRGVSFVGNGDARHASPCLVIDAARPSRVWAAPQQGLHRSDDGGETFSIVPSFAPQTGYNASLPPQQQGLAFVSLVQHPETPALGEEVVVGIWHGGLAFSPDGGTSWTLTVNITAKNLTGGSLPLTIFEPQKFLRAPNGTAFFGAADGIPPENPSWRRYVLRVTGSSSSAAAASAGPASWAFQDITPHPGGVGSWQLIEAPYGWGEGSTLVACAQYPDSLYESGDSGATWAQRNMSVTANKPVWWSEDPGHTFVPFGRDALVVSRLRPERWLIASGFGVFASTDRGDTWGGSSAGIGQVVMFRCHSHPTLPNFTFCGCMDLVAFILRGGEQPPLAAFNKLPGYWDVDFGKGVAWQDAQGGSPALWFAGNEQENGSYGQWVAWEDPLSAANVTWVSVTNSTGDLRGLHFRYTELLQAQDDPLDLLLGVGGAAQYFPWNTSEPNSAYMGGIVRSRDGGASWHHIKAQPRDGVIGGQFSDFGQLSLDGGDADARWYGNCNFGLFLSRDRGETWAKVGPWGMWQQIAVKPDTLAGKGSVWAFSTLGPPGSALMHTRDYGATWTVVGNFTTLPYPAPDYAYPFLAVQQGRIALAAAAPGDAYPHIYVSFDTGVSWTAIDDAAAGTAMASNIMGLEWDAFHPTLYVSTGGRSVAEVHF